jgi:hypothetical protein
MPAGLGEDRTTFDFSDGSGGSSVEPSRSIEPPEGLYGQAGLFMALLRFSPVATKSNLITRGGLRLRLLKSFPSGSPL